MSSITLERPVAAVAPAALLPLLRELGDLKRTRSAQYEGSVATRRFRTAWAALLAGEAPARVMEAVTASTLAAARLGDLDADVLGSLGLTGSSRSAVLRDAFDAVAGEVPQPLNARLRAALETVLLQAEPPPFVSRLERQPRAGVTCPGKPRILLEPPENHAEHCLIVAVYGVLLSPAYGADPVDVFMAGMTHHLHSAAMPDSGFTGEVLLGRHLDAVIAESRRQAWAQLPPALQQEADRVCAPIATDATAEARAFHAADVIDRVLQIEQHLKAASLSMTTVLGEFELVHDGPVKPFHDRVLAQVGLL